MDENPYKSPQADSTPRLSRRGKFIAFISVIALLGLASYVLGVLIAPADPISVYLCTVAIWLLASASYVIGIYHGNRQIRLTSKQSANRAA